MLKVGEYDVRVPESSLAIKKSCSSAEFSKYDDDDEEEEEWNE